MCVCLLEFVCMSAYVFECVCLYINTYICVCVRARLCIRACMYVPCACVAMCVRFVCSCRLFTVIYVFKRIVYHRIAKIDFTCSDTVIAYHCRPAGKKRKQMTAFKSGSN